MYQVKIFHFLRGIFSPFCMVLQLLSHSSHSPSCLLSCLGTWVTDSSWLCSHSGWCFTRTTAHWKTQEMRWWRKACDLQQFSTYLWNSPHVPESSALLIQWLHNNCVTSPVCFLNLGLTISSPADLHRPWHFTGLWADCCVVFVWGLVIRLIRMLHSEVLHEHKVAF